MTVQQPEPLPPIAALTEQLQLTIEVARQICEESTRIVDASQRARDRRQGGR